VQVDEVPFGRAYPTGGTSEQAPEAWIDVPSKASRVVLIELAHGRPYAPLEGANRYRITFEQLGGADLTTEASMFDAIRDPIRR
jgi:hypothetical protein